MLTRLDDIIADLFGAGNSPERQASDAHDIVTSAGKKLEGWITMLAAQQPKDPILVQTINELLNGTKTHLGFVDMVAAFEREFPGHPDIPTFKQGLEGIKVNFEVAKGDAKNESNYEDVDEALAA